MEIICAEKPWEKLFPKLCSQAGSQGLKCRTLHTNSSSVIQEMNRFMTFSVLKKKKKSETFYKLTELSKEKGLMVPALSPLLNHTSRNLHWVMLYITAGCCHDFVVRFNPQFRAQRLSLMYNCHVSGYQVHLRHLQCCDTRSHSDCPLYSPTHLPRGNTERGGAREGRITRNPLF